MGMTDLYQRMQVAWVPGSFELPVVAKCMAKSGQFDAVVAIGAVVSSCGRMVAFIAQHRIGQHEVMAAWLLS